MKRPLLVIVFILLIFVPYIRSQEITGYIESENTFGTSKSLSAINLRIRGNLSPDKFAWSFFGVYSDVWWEAHIGPVFVIDDGCEVAIGVGAEDGSVPRFGGTFSIFRDDWYLISVHEQGAEYWYKNILQREGLHFLILGFFPKGDLGLDRLYKLIFRNYFSCGVLRVVIMEKIQLKLLGGLPFN